MSVANVVIRLVENKATGKKDVNISYSREEDALPIEHEDALLSIDEGFRKAVSFLRSVMPVEPAMSEAWWT